ncbi:hypothetical protein WKR88_11805 [Trinickia caryophylli]|uniref:Uncharacterized protein n=1 Tax=Trinickia caryophylli TaxID=28094 RepID=A0A1X7CXG4_TRICW|nr:hypothetical protein [Trinickia caryophylli]TRX13684.1 hypothetical protein FNF07_20030 [Trinickia caryophylli]WQE15268.1 hypothetical protein U0034_22255 [Trinickia caryophylli]GLU30983.1 hypothetical protein Busp01_08250 [Trinickia caryophylli]SMF04820.1 hypothetical protein SAMN06295900_102107 [Trinickia caryophylli]
MRNDNHGAIQFPAECKRCGASVPEPVSFCPFCGAHARFAFGNGELPRVGQPRAQQPPRSAQPQRPEPRLRPEQPSVGRPAPRGEPVWPARPTPLFATSTDAGFDFGGRYPMDERAGRRWGLKIGTAVVLAAFVLGFGAVALLQRGNDGDGAAQGVQEAATQSVDGIVRPNEASGNKRGLPSAELSAPATSMATPSQGFDGASGRADANPGSNSANDADIRAARRDQTSRVDGALASVQPPGTAAPPARTAPMPGADQLARPAQPAQPVQPTQPAEPARLAQRGAGTEPLPRSSPSHLVNAAPAPAPAAGREPDDGVAPPAMARDDGRANRAVAEVKVPRKGSLERVPAAMSSPPPAQTASTRGGAERRAASVSRSLALAQTGLAKGNLALAKQALATVRSIQPGNSQAYSLQQDLTLRERARDDALSQARSCAVQQRWNCAWHHAGDALAADSSSADAKGLLQRAMIESGGAFRPAGPGPDGPYGPVAQQ